MALIAGDMGWTPGNTSAAANVAKTMGIAPDADMNLSDPKQMSAFLRALTQQEHGSAAKLYGDDVYATAAGAVSTGANSDMTPAQSMANSLRQRYGRAPIGTPKSTTGAVPISPAPIPGELDKLKAALGGKKYDADWLATSEAMTKQGQDIAASAKNPLGAIGGTLIAGIGGYNTGTETANKKADEAALVASLGGGSAPPAVKALLESSNPDHRAAGIDAMLKLATAKPTNKWQPAADGTYIVNEPTGEVRKTGAERRDQNAPGEVKMYEFDMAQRAEQGQPQVPFAEWIKTKKLSEESFGKTPVWGVDAEGNPALVQVSDRGRGTQTTLPEGVKVGKDPIKMDAGTEWILLDPVTRQPVGRIPKDVAGEARQKQIGEGEGKRLIAQPETKASVRSSLSGLDRLVSAADKLKGMPGLPSATGNLQGRSFVPTISQDTKDAETELETLKSQVAFTVLQAMRDASKSGGALGSIAVEELKMLQNNLASLDTLQGDDKFKQSLDAIREYAEGAKARLQRGYKDTYGEDFDVTEPPPDAANQPAAGGGSYKVLKVH
jgi:hypothetical protein